MATPVFKFQHPDLPEEDLYFIHNTFFEQPQTIPMDLSTFIFFHLRTGRTLEGFFAAWDNLNEFQASLNGASFDNYFDENQKQQLYDDAIFGMSLKEALKNQKETVKLKEFIDFEKFKTEDISDYVNPNINLDYLNGGFKLSFFYSRHYFMQYIYDNFNDKLDESDSYKYDKEILLALIKINGLGLSLASENFKKDREVLLLAIKNDFRSIYFADDSLKKDKSFIIEAIKSNYKVIALINSKFQNDNDVIYEHKKQECLSFFKKEIESIEATEYSFRTNSQEVYDEDCSQETINFYNNISNEIEDTLLNLKEYAENGPFFFAFESSFPYDLFKDDDDYVLSLFKLWPHYLVDYTIFNYTASSRLLQSKEFIVELLKSETKGQVLWSWEKLPTSYWSNDEFVKAAVKVDGIALQYADDTFKKVKDVVILALKSNKNALEFIDESLKNDEDVLALLSNKPIEINDSEEDEELPF